VLRETPAPPVTQVAKGIQFGAGFSPAGQLRIIFRPFETIKPPQKGPEVMRSREKGQK
jgi:hypothetical protein